MGHYFTKVPPPHIETFNILLTQQVPSSQLTRMLFNTRLLVTASKSIILLLGTTNALQSRFIPLCFSTISITQDLAMSSFCLSNTYKVSYHEN